MGTPWRPDEDALLRDAVDRYGENDNWKLVAKHVPGRSNKACRKVSRPAMCFFQIVDDRRCRGGSIRCRRT